MVMEIWVMCGGQLVTGAVSLHAGRAFGACAILEPTGEASPLPTLCFVRLAGYPPPRAVSAGRRQMKARQ